MKKGGPRTDKKLSEEETKLVQELAHIIVKAFLWEQEQKRKTEQENKLSKKK